MTSDRFDVTAIVIGAADSPYLAATLAAVAEQTRPLDRLFVGLLDEDGAEPQAPLPDAETPAGGGLGTVQIEYLRDAAAFGSAVTAVLHRHPDLGGWLWLLHDDAAPDPTALAEQLATAERASSAAIVGAKQVGWDDPDTLISVGVSLTRDGQRLTGIEDGEIDQGQHDGREDVHCVGTAGMLISHRMWSLLNGPDPVLGPYGDGADLSRRARLAGGRVLVCPAARIRHARASYTGRRAAGTHPPDRRRSFRARRTAQLHTWLTSAPWPAIIPIAILAVVLAPIRALWRFARTEPALAFDEVLAVLTALLRPGAIVRARRQAARSRRSSARRLTPLRATWREVWHQRRNRRMQASAQRRAARAPSELEIAERAAVARRRRAAFTVVLIPTALVALLTLGPAAFSGPLIGGALAPVDGTFADVWRAATSSWLERGDGYPGPVDAFTALLGVLSAVTGGFAGVPVQTTIALVLVLAMPIAAIGGWFATGAASRSVVVRAWAAGMWAFGPPLLLALTDGRLGAIVAHLALPFVALGIARALGVDSRDVIVSGMVGARRVSRRTSRTGAARDAKRTQLAALAAGGSSSAQVRPPVHVEDVHVEDVHVEDVPDDDGADDDGADDEPAEGGDDAAQADGIENADETAEGAGSVDETAEGAGSVEEAADDGAVDEAADDGPLAGARDEPGPADPDPAERLHVVSRASGVGSLGAAAAAGLAFAVAVAGAPVLLPAGIAALLLLAVALGRGRHLPVGRWRLALVALPAVVLTGPHWLGALRTDGGWRALLADPGVPAVSDPGPAWLTALSWPQEPPALTWDAWSETVVPLAASGALVLAALASLLRAGARTSAVRIGWLLAVVGVATALVSSRTFVSVGQEPGGADVWVTGWAGPGTSLVLLGLLLASISALSGLRGALAGRSFGWRQVTSAIVIVAVVAGLIVSAVSWTADVLRDRQEQSAFAFQTRQDEPVPALGLTVQSEPQGARVLALTPTASGIDAQLWRSQGPQLTETSTRLGTAALIAAEQQRAPDDADAALLRLIGDLASGSAEGITPMLQEHAIAVVLVPPAGSPVAPAGDETARSRMVAQLDSIAGLERVTENASGTVWRVASPPQAPIAAARVLTQEGEVVASGTTVGADVRLRLQAQGDGRVLVLSERASSAWRAELDGRSLRAVSHGWQQAFAIPDDASGTLTVQHRPSAHATWLIVTVVVLGVTALLALPTRRRRTEVER